MTAPSAQTLQRLAGDTGLPAGTLEKVLRLMDVRQESCRLGQAQCTHPCPA